MARLSSTKEASFSLSLLPFRTEANGPRMRVRGVRSSWETLAKKRDFSWSSSFSSLVRTSSSSLSFSVCRRRLRWLLGHQFLFYGLPFKDQFVLSGLGRIIAQADHHDGSINANGYF